MSSVSILHCGWLAEQVFEQNTRINSLGATSKAAYLLSPDGQVVILSFDRYHSPLTCTLRTFSPELRALTPGEVFEISPQALTHPTITLQRQGAKIWRESMPAGRHLDAFTSDGPRSLLLAATRRHHGPQSGKTLATDASLGEDPQA